MDCLRVIATYISPFILIAVMFFYLVFSLGATLIAGITQMNSAYYMFSSPLEYIVTPKTFNYFNGIEPGAEKLLCNFTSDKKGCNSTPRDVIITCAVGKTLNIVLFQRTLRTTGSNATLLLFLDQTAVDNMDKDTYEFTKKMNSQIILVPTPPGQGLRVKNYDMYIFVQFLRENEFKIDRVIFLDLFDSLFQEDPFNTRMPENELHLVHERMLNKYNGGNNLFI